MTVLSSNFSGKIPFGKRISGHNESTIEVDTTVIDIQLWEEFIAGSDSAFSTIYNDYADGLYGYGMKLVHHREIVMDAIQDLFVSLWASRENLGSVQSVKAYLFTSLRRRLFANSTKQRRLILVGQEIEPFLKSEIASSEQKLIEQEHSEREENDLNKALTHLSEKQREIIYLRFYAMMGYDEIAKVMATDKKAVYNLMARTIERLKKFMGGMLLILFLISV